MNKSKILIFGQTFDRTSGGGITLSSLFEGWNKENIAVANIGHKIDASDTDICNIYYSLGKKEHKWVFPFNIFRKDYPSGIIQINNKGRQIDQQQNQTLRIKFIDFIFYPLLKFLGLFHKISSIKLSEELCRWLNEFKPDILYVQVSERDGILFARELHSFLKIPMVIHNMDDWPSTISTVGPFKKYWQKKIDREFKQLINRSSLLLCISDEMAIDYKNRYQKDAISFHNTIKLEFWKRFQKSDYSLKDPITILYAGRIGLGIENSLESAAMAIQELKGQLKMPIRFILQTQKKLSWFEKYDCIEHKPFIAYADLPKKFSEADFLILPYDFSQKSINFIRHSMPTKVPEYMISGTPILVFAPKWTAVAKYAEKFKWAKVVTKNSPIELASAFKYLIENKTGREQLGGNAKYVAEKNHDSQLIGNNFKDTLYLIARSKS